MNLGFEWEGKNGFYVNGNYCMLWFVVMWELAPGL